MALSFCNRGRQKVVNSRPLCLLRYVMVVFMAAMPLPASAGEICSTRGTSFTLQRSEVAYFKADSSSVTVKMTSPECNLNVTKNIYDTGIMLDFLSSGLKIWKEVRFLDCEELMISFDNKITRLQTNNQQADSKCKVTKIKFDVENVRKLGKPCNDHENVNDDTYLCQSNEDEAYSADNLFDILDKLNAQQEKVLSEPKHDFDGHLWEPPINPEILNPINNKEVLPKPLSPIPSFDFDFPTLPPNFDFPTLPPDFDIPPYKNTDFTSHSDSSYGGHIIFIPVGAIVLLISICIRLCFCRRARVLQRVQTITIVRRVAPLDPEGNTLTESAQMPDNNLDLPPAYSDIQNEVAPPPPYSEIEKEQSNSLTQDGEAPQTSPDNSTEAATTAPPPPPSTDSDSSSANPNRTLKSQYSFQPLKEED